jgi:uncharacterized membrane protein
MTFLYWLFLFYLFSFMGWIIECTVESINHRQLLNRGSLWGPYIPIYGLGGILFALVGIPLKEATDNTYYNVLLVYFVGTATATLLEYWVGSVLERVFKKQFWDYSTLKLTYKFSYKNRISLVSSLFFGLLCLFQTYFLFERVYPFAESLNYYLLITINIVMTLAFGIDIFVQVRRYEQVQEFLQKLSYEQLRETLHKNLLRVAGASQIREFRDNVYKNVRSNVERVQESVKCNVGKVQENIKKIVLPAKSLTDVVGHDDPGVPSPERGRDPGLPNENENEDE